MSSRNIPAGRAGQPAKDRMGVHDSQVRAILGEATVNHILEAVRDEREINGQKMKDIAQRLGVGGRHKDREEISRLRSGCRLPPQKNAVDRGLYLCAGPYTGLARHARQTPAGMQTTPSP